MQIKPTLLVHDLNILLGCTRYAVAYTVWVFIIRYEEQWLVIRVPKYRRTESPGLQL